MVVSAAITQRYDLKNTKPWVNAAGQLLGSMFGIKTIYGWRQSDPFPDHPSGHALDFMTDIPNGNALASYAIANANALGIKYIIHNRQVWNPKQGWHSYTSTSNPHTDHVHITFNDNPGPAYTNGSLNTQLLGNGGGTGIDPNAVAAGLGNLGDDKDVLCAWKLNLTVSKPCVLTKTQARALLGGTILAAGGVIALFGVALLTIMVFRSTDTGRAVVSDVQIVASALPGGRSATRAAGNVR